MNVWTNIYIGCVKFGVSIESIAEYKLYMVDGTHIDEDELLKENFVLEAQLVLAKNAADLKDARIKVTNRHESKLSDDETTG